MQTNKLSELAEFLKKIRSGNFSVDSDFAYALAKTEQWSALDSLLKQSRTCNFQRVGDTLFEEGQAASSDVESRAAFQAAKIFFSKAPNHAKLTACHLKLGDNLAAVDAAKRAGSSKAWTDVVLAAIECSDFTVAHSAALNVVNYSDHLEQVVEAYEASGHFDQLLALLEEGASVGGKGNVGIFTELGVAYAKYRPAKLIDFLKSSQVITAGRLNVPKLIKVCDQKQLWKPTVLLYLSYNEFDQAAQSIIRHSAVAWDHDTFVNVLQKVSNSDHLYKAIGFYLDEHPLLLDSLITAVSVKLDHSRVISTVKQHALCLNAVRPSESGLALIQKYLEFEQRTANEITNAVNDALHELYLDQKDILSLKKSILQFTAFDQSEMAKRLEGHEVRLLAYCYIICFFSSLR